PAARSCDCPTRQKFPSYNKSKLTRLISGVPCQRTNQKLPRKLNLPKRQTNTTTLRTTIFAIGTAVITSTHQKKLPLSDYFVVSHSKQLQILVAATGVYVCCYANMLTKLRSQSHHNS